MEKDYALQNEKNNRLLLSLEWFIIFVSVTSFLTLLFITSNIEMLNFLKIILTILAIVILVTSLCLAIKIEQIAGFYKCGKCENKYIPRYNQVFLAMHMCRTRYMKCPKCNKYSWNKKVLKK